MTTPVVYVSVPFLLSLGTILRRLSRAARSSLPLFPTSPSPWPVLFVLLTLFSPTRSFRFVMCLSLLASLIPLRSIAFLCCSYG